MSRNLSVNDLNFSGDSPKYVTTSVSDGVATITMNRPDKLNGWTMEMMDAFKEAFIKADSHQDVKAIIFTGNGSYYSAGVNLGGTIKVMHPKALKKMIVDHNQKLFEAFLLCKKPILVAVNGPAIGASVTSATLCNGVIASENATFSTPFAALGIVPEGCSSIHFARLMGEQNAQRMLGKEGWKPTAKEAHDAGLIQGVFPEDKLKEEALKIAKEWVANGEERKFLAGSELDELLRVNAEESVALADAFLGAEFMKEQGRFLWSKKKHAPAAVFYSLWALRPLWSRLM